MRQRSLIRLAALLLFLAPSAFGQRTVTLHWTLSASDVASACSSSECYQTIYRAPGACSAASDFAALSVLDPTVDTFVETAVPTGTWCYAISFTRGVEESIKDSATVYVHRRRHG